MWRQQQATDGSRRGWLGGGGSATTSQPSEQEARPQELREFIALRRAVLQGGKGWGGGGQQCVRRRTVPTSAVPVAPPCSWQAIKQQAHAGFEQMLRQAGLPVNAGFSRPSSFTAAGAPQWLHAPPAVLPAHQAAGAGAGWASPQLPAATVAHMAAAPPLSLQRQQYAAYLTRAMPPSPLPASVDCSSAELARCESQLLRLDSDVHVSASWQGGSTGRRPSSELERGSARCSSGHAAGTGSSSHDGGGGGAGTSSWHSSTLEVLVAAAEDEDVPRLEADSCERLTDQLPSSVAAPPVSAVEDDGLAVTASGSMSSVNKAIKSPAPGARLDTSLPHVESEARLQASGEHHAVASPQTLSVAKFNEATLPSSNNVVGIIAPAPTETMCAQQDAAQLAKEAVNPAAEEVDFSVAAAAVLARFQQLQEQLLQLQAGLVPAAVAVPVAASHAAQSTSPAPNCRSSGAALHQPVPSSNSTVQAVMMQAESFMLQAQDLLKRIHAASASPCQSPAQHAWRHQQPARSSQHTEEFCPPRLGPQHYAEEEEHGPAATAASQCEGLELSEGPPSWRMSTGNEHSVPWQPAVAVQLPPPPRHPHLQQHVWQQPHPQVAWPLWAQPEASYALPAGLHGASASPARHWPATWQPPLQPMAPQPPLQQQQRKPARLPISYASRQQQIAPCQVSTRQQGNYMQAARLAKERAAREAAEHQRLQQQNEATRQAARRRALQTKQQQAQQLAEQLWQPTKRQNPLRSSFYMQRLRGRQHGQGESQAVPEWAKAARPLPPLLPLQPKQQQQGVVQPASSGNLVVDAGLTPSALEQQELVQQVQLGVGRQLTDEEQRLHAELDELDARMAQRGSPTKRLPHGTCSSSGLHDLQAASVGNTNSALASHGGLTELARFQQGQEQVQEQGACPDNPVPAAAALSRTPVSALEQQEQPSGKSVVHSAEGQVNFQLVAPEEQQPLQWRPRHRMLAPALDAAAEACSRAVDVQRAGGEVTTQKAPEAGAVCHINIANVGMRCPGNSLASAAAAHSGSSGGSQSTSGIGSVAVLPPLHPSHRWNAARVPPADSQAEATSGSAAPVLRTATRAAERATTMQPMSGGWWQQWQQRQQHQQQVAPAWQQQQQHPQAWPAWQQPAWWTQWQQYGQPVQQHAGQWGFSGRESQYGGAMVHWQQ